MKLYEIDAEILNCIDAESGEIINAEKLNALQIERERKIENVALWVKNLNADLRALKAEKEAFAEREKQTKAKIDSLSRWLGGALGYTRFETPKVKISFRNSEAVEITDEQAIQKNTYEKKLKQRPTKRRLKKL